MYTKKFITKGLDKNKPLIWDTETLGLYGRTRLIQVRQGDVHYEYDCFYINIEDIKYYFKDWHLVLHNAFYDLNCIDFKRWLPRKFDDTMVLARFKWPHLESHSLKSLSQFLCLSNKGEEGASDWGSYNLSQEQLNYAANDTLLTEQIFAHFDGSIFKMPSYKLEIISLRLACVYSHQGMILDTKAIRKEIAADKKALTKLGGKLPSELNINSPKQVKEFLGTESSDRLTLVKLDTERANDILEIRRLTKRLTYLESMLPYKWAYSLIKPGAAKTGRFTSSGWDVSDDYFNLQQIPRDLKHIFAVHDGSYFVCADYPMLEIWLSAASWGDPFMLEALYNKEDIHRKTASAMFNKPPEEVSTRERKIAKTCNFNLLYGAGAKRFHETLSTMAGNEVAKDSDEFRLKWHSIYKKIVSLHKSEYEYFKHNECRVVHTPLGRPMMARSANEALNFPIQGGGAECTKTALWLLDKKGIRIVNTVHDSITLIAANKEEAEYYAKEVKAAMEEAFSIVTRNCLVNDLKPQIEPEIGETYA